MDSCFHDGFVYALTITEPLCVQVIQFVFSGGDGWHLAGASVAPAAVGRWYKTPSGRIWIEVMVCAE